MSTEDINKYFEILELTPDASLSDARNAYLNLRALYSNDSLVTAAIAYEFSEQNKQEILEQIEEAYVKLTDFFKNKNIESAPKERPSIDKDDIKEYIEHITAFNGRILRQLREKLGIELKDMAKFTRIRKQYLEDIELERFSDLPAEVYLRGYVAEYARYFSLDVSRVANDYMAIYTEWKTTAKDKS